MEKTYTKEGYTYTDESGRVITITKEKIVQSISDMTKLKTNIDDNLTTLNTDLENINNVIQ